MAATIAATAEESLGRVRIEIAGGITGDSVYVIRRDSQGSNLVRETTGDGMLWESSSANVRTNLALNPSFEAGSGTVTVRTNLATNPTAASTTNWAAIAGTGGTTAALANSALAGYSGQNFNRVTWTAATTAVSGGLSYTQTGLSSAIAYTHSLWVRSSKTQRLALTATYRDGALATVNTVTGSDVVVPAATWTQLTVSGTSGAAVNNVVLSAVAVVGTSGTNWAIGDTLDGDAVLIEGSTLLDSYFDGTTAAAGDFTFAWSGTAHASTSIQRAVGIDNWSAATSVVAFQSAESARNGTKSAKVIKRFSTASNTELTFSVATVTGEIYTVSAWVKASSGSPQVRLSNGTLTGATVTTNASWQQISLTLTATGGSTTFLLETASAGAAGDAFLIDSVLAEHAAFVDTYFDGSTGTNDAWTGAAHASASTNSDAALPVTLFDYEARQGLSTDYIVTDDVGNPGAFTNLVVPNWGTWLKDPFRPFMNCRVLWNSDSAYVRKANRERLQARGAKFPVFHSDRRTAPAGSVRVGTETNDEAKALVALLDLADTIMVDVAPEFGVPVRYVAVGDLTGIRVGDTELSLKWEARYWELPIEEVAMPIGAPVNQSLSYDGLAAAFGSYVAIPATVDSYYNVAAGAWS